MKYLSLLLVMVATIAMGDWANSPQFPDTKCTGGNVVLYIDNVAQTPTYSQPHTANVAAIALSQRLPGKTVTLKFPDVNCLTTWKNNATYTSAANSSSVSSSSKSSSSVSIATSASSSVVSSSTSVASSNSVSSVSNTGVSVIYQNDFEAQKVPSGDSLYFTANNGASLSISTDTTLNYGNSKGSIKGSYPIASGDGGYFVWGTIGIPQRDINELFVEFKAKMPGNKQGNKFLKIFGQYTKETGYANTTFGLDYTSGDMYAVSFGSGENDGVPLLQNDTHNVILFGGEYPKWIGRSYGTAVVKLPQKKSFIWDNEWHHFRFMVRFNSGTSPETEKPDGAYYVEIDGKVYVDAKNVYNRHHLNKPIDRIELFGWTQNGTKPFEQLYDDVIVTTGNFLTNPINKDVVVNSSSVASSISSSSSSVVTVSSSSVTSSSSNSSVTSIPSGSTLELVIPGMGNKTSTAYYDDLSNRAVGNIGAPFATAIGPIKASYNPSNAQTIDTDSIVGANSLRVDYGKYYFPKNYIELNKPQRFLFSAYIKITGDLTTANIWKFGRIGSGEVYGGAPRAGESYTSNPLPNGFAGEGWTATSMVSWSQHNKAPASAELAYVKDKWLLYTFEHYVGTPGKSDSFTNVYVDNKPVLLWTNRPYLLTSDAKELPDWFITPINGLDGNTKAVLYMDGIYFDTSLARVMVTDKPVFADSTKVNLLPINSIVGDKVIVRNAAVGFTKGEKGYVHAWTETGTYINSGVVVNF